MSLSPYPLQDVVEGWQLWDDLAPVKMWENYLDFTLFRIRKIRSVDVKSDLWIAWRGILRQ